MRSAIHEPSEETVGSGETPTVCGVVLSDLHVVVAIGRVGWTGSIHLLCAKHEPLARRRFYAPEGIQIKKALIKCWEDLGMPPGGADYSHVFVCIPGDACRVTTSTARVTIQESVRGAVSTPHVQAGDIRSVEDQACDRPDLPGYVVVDLIRDAFETDSGSRLSEARHAVTNTLTLHARLVMGDRNTVMAMLDGLRELGVRGDVLMSSCSAMAGHLVDEHPEDPVVVAEIDAWHACVSLHAEGRVLALRRVDGGWMDVRRKTAAALNVPEEDFRLWLNDKEPLFRKADPGEVLSWPWTRPHARGVGITMGDIMAAAATPTTCIAEGLDTATQDLSRDEGIRPSKIIIMGDDPLTNRALVSVLPLRGAPPCEWRIPERVFGHAYGPFVSYARMTGLLRHGIFCRHRRQPFLEAYNQSLFDLVNRRIGSVRWRGRRMAPPPAGQVEGRCHPGRLSLAARLLS